MPFQSENQLLATNGSGVLWSQWGKPRLVEYQVIEVSLGEYVFLSGKHVERPHIPYILISLYHE